MGDNFVSKPLGLVLIVTAHMVFNGANQVEVTGIVGTNLTFEFTFNISVTKDVAVYTMNLTKIAGYSQGKSSSREGNFEVYPKNNTVLVRITNLKPNHSGIYCASLFMDSGLPVQSNNKVRVEVENRSSTVLPMTTEITAKEDIGSPSFFSSHIVTVLVVLPVVLLAAVLPFLIWCLLRAKDKQEETPQQSSNPPVQETVEACSSVPTPPLVYSVLDFPKRPSAVLEINPSDTEYAAVSYLPDKRQV